MKQQIIATPELEGPVRSETRNGMRIDWDVPLPMDDGLILRADVYRPIAEGRYLRSKAIPLTAYASLAQGRAANDPTLAAIGRKHRATAAQVAIAWLLDQEGVIAIPKAGRPESQKANLEALTISLDDEDRATIAALPKDQRFVRPPFAPEWDAVL